MGLIECEISSRAKIRHGTIGNVRYYLFVLHYKAQVGKEKWKKMFSLNKMSKTFGALKCALRPSTKKCKPTAVLKKIHIFLKNKV